MLACLFGLTKKTDVELIKKQQIPTNRLPPPPLLYIFVRKNIIQNISTTYASSQSHSIFFRAINFTKKLLLLKK